MKAFFTGGTGLYAHLCDLWSRMTGKPTVVSVDIKDGLDWFRDEGMLV